MTNVNDVYGGDFLKAEHLKQYALPVTVHIKGVEVTSFEDKRTQSLKRQIVVTFHQLDRRLGLNKTNADMLAHMYGPEADAWIDREVTLTVLPVSGPNGMTMGVRVVTPGMAPPPAPAAPALQAPPQSFQAPQPAQQAYQPPPQARNAPLQAPGAPGGFAPPPAAPPGGFAPPVSAYQGIPGAGEPEDGIPF